MASDRGGFSKSKGAKSTEEEAKEIEDILVRIATQHPIELEERIETLAKPLIIECACPGWQPRNWGPPRVYPVKKPLGYQEGGVRYPAVPVTIEDQVRESVLAIKAGAAALHIHPRDPKDGMGSYSSNLLAQVYDGIFSEVDAIASQAPWRRTDDGTIDFIEDMEELLELGEGNRYCQGAVVLWPPTDSYPSNYARSVQDGIRFMEKHDVKPIHKLRGTYHVRNMERVLLDTGVITQMPLLLVHDMGHPFGWPLDQDPWVPLDMVTSIMQTKQRMPKDSVIGVFSGGRNWMPITMTAILMGVDMVRVGIEDTYWMYPHRDEVIQRNMDCVNKIVDFCSLIGRRIAGVDEARKILGMKLTSPKITYPQSQTASQTA